MATDETFDHSITLFNFIGSLSADLACSMSFIYKLWMALFASWDVPTTAHLSEVTRDAETI